MIRLIMREDDMGHAANAGGPVVTQFKTFDVDLPAVEEWLRQSSGIYSQRQLAGIELLPAASTNPKE